MNDFFSFLQSAMWKCVGINYYLSNLLLRNNQLDVNLVWKKNQKFSWKFETSAFHRNYNWPIQPVQLIEIVLFLSICGILMWLFLAVRVTVKTLI